MSGDGRHGRSGSSPTKMLSPGETIKYSLLRRLSTRPQTDEPSPPTSSLRRRRTMEHTVSQGGEAHEEVPVWAALRQAVSASSPAPSLTIQDNSTSDRASDVNSSLATASPHAYNLRARDSWFPPGAQSSQQPSQQVRMAMKAQLRERRRQQLAAEAVLMEGKNQQLMSCVRRMRASWSPGHDPGYVDNAFEAYAGMQKAAYDLVRALLSYPSGKSRLSAARESRSGAGRNGSVEETVERLEMLSIGGGGGGGVSDGGKDRDMSLLGTSLGELDLSDDEGDAFETAGRVSEVWRATICDWRAVVQKLLDAHWMSLATTYQMCEKGAPVDDLDRMFTDASFRAAIIGRMKNSVHYRAATAVPGFWPRYERRFQHYDCLKKAVAEIDRLLKWEKDGLAVARGGGEETGEAEGREKGDRLLWKYTIAPRGDAILEFANNTTDNDDDDDLAADARAPILQFRVSSHILSETSPLFARLFAEGVLREPDCEDDPDYHLRLHPDQGDRDRRQRSSSAHIRHTRQCRCCHCPPRAVTCADGTRVQLYSMPQAERNDEGALEILLHAAHTHVDHVPRAVGPERLAAIAAACMRYSCTAPLEVFVEHLWLPAWLREAGGESPPDALLVVSYAFGLRRLFSRLSKTAVLHVADEAELEAKPWPRKVKDRIWALRNAKIAQVYAVCASAVHEYLRPPSLDSPPPPNAPQLPPTHSEVPPPPYKSQILSPSQRRHSSTPPHRQTLAQPMLSSTKHEIPPHKPFFFSLTSTPRCPRGSHACDAASLGWLMLVLNELHLVGAGRAVQLIPLPAPDPSSSPPSHHAPSSGTDTPSSPSRSLAQLLDKLRRIPGPPPAPNHAKAGVCDPAPALRAAVDDVYNSVSGLTLFEVDGKRHGWALSRRAADAPREVHLVPLGVFGNAGDGGGGGKNSHESLGAVRQNGLDMVIPDDLHAGATGEHRQNTEVAFSGAWDDPGGGEQEELVDMVADMRIEDIHGTLRHDSDGTTACGDGGDGNNGDNTDLDARSQIRPFTPDESTCLRILRLMDKPGDLLSTALVSRTFLAAFRNNELSLARGLIRAQRRLTLSALMGPSYAIDDTSSTFSSIRAAENGAEKLLEITTTMGSTPAEEHRSEEPESTGTMVISSKKDRNDDDDDDDNNNDKEACNDDKPEYISTGDFVSGYHMTEEEAHRILWPDQPPGGSTSEGTLQSSDSTSIVQDSPAAQEHQQQKPRGTATEKVLLSRVAVTENKMLVAVGPKSLREQRDKKIGLLAG